MYKRMLLFPLFVSLICCHAVAEDLPAIYLERVASVNQALARTLKIKYDQCVSSKEILYKIKNDMGEGSIAWEAAKENYDKEILRNVNFPPLPEPDWTKLTPKRVEEFFDQEKYASRIYTSRYRINMERCQLVEQKDLDLRIDNGEREYKIAFKDKKKNLASTPGVFVPISGDHYKSHKVKQRLSPRVSRDKLLANNEELRSMPDALKKLGHIMTLETQGVEPGARPGMPGKEELRFLEDTLGYEHRDYKKPNPVEGISPAYAGKSDRVIAGQPCDLTKLDAVDGKLCVWHRMNRYPDQYGAQVVLLKEVRVGDQIHVEEAKTFKLKESIDPKVFELPPGVRVR